MDDAFVKCIKNIEQHYVHFSKFHRLRIEKWVEKLALSSSTNPTWKRQRDLYAKLLLGMVLSRNLEDPFDQIPQDGPLPTFPSEKYYKFKDLLGSRESSFWKQIHDVIENSNTSGPVLPSKLVQEDFTIRRKIMSSMIPGREIQNLTLLIKEQANRIKILENQINDERIMHEISLQKLVYKHQLELEAFQNFHPIDENRNTSFETNKSIPSSHLPDHKNIKTSPTSFHNKRSEKILNISPNNRNSRFQNRPNLNSSTIDIQDNSSEVRGRKEVWNEYMQYLDKFQDDIKGLKI
jgi:hypothetical protein